MSNIKWEDGAVCFVDRQQWAYGLDIPKELGGGFTISSKLVNLIEAIDFQLNTIKQGDYIEASELDTEQKYNDAVEVLELFGFDPYEREFNKASRRSNEIFFISDDLLLIGTSSGSELAKRKITYKQLMAIGKLKRAMIERDVKIDVEMMTEKMNNAAGKSVDKAEKLEGEWTDKHYNNFYQLTEEDIKAGKIKVDAYFVNRMWRINSWDDTGAGFHILKTLPRIANNKNPLKRELVALKKQVDLLCKMHGVDDGGLK